jgi:hypothetical protein
MKVGLMRLENNRNTPMLKTQMIKKAILILIFFCFIESIEHHAIRNFIVKIIH